MPPLGQVFFREDGRDGAGRYTGSTVDTLIGVDVELIASIVNALHWTNFLTASVFNPNTGLGYDVRHFPSPLFNEQIHSVGPKVAQFIGRTFLLEPGQQVHRAAHVVHQQPLTGFELR